MSVYRRKTGASYGVAAGILLACCQIVPRGLHAQDRGGGTSSNVAAASQSEREPDRVVLKNGSSLVVRKFEITEKAVEMEALTGQFWSIWAELVDLDRTRQANVMSPGEARSPGWKVTTKPISAPASQDTLATATAEPKIPPERPPEATISPPSLPSDRLVEELWKARAEHEESLARAKAEYAEVTRLLVKEMERLGRRIQELERAKTPEHMTLAMVQDATLTWAPEDQTKTGSEGEASTAPAEEEENVEYEEAIAQAKADYEAKARSIAREYERLNQRVKELEMAQAAQEDATRAIIRDAASTLGSKINQFVALGGTFELAGGWFKHSSGRSESLTELSTAELDFEVQANDWTLGSLILEHDTGGRTLFQSADGFERINIDTAFLTIGDPQRFPPMGTVGRIILPFGISTGDPVADVPTLEDPLTVEVFEMRETAILVGAGFPTPPATPATPPVAPPPVRPRAIQPFFRSISRGLGYDPPPRPPEPPTPVTPPPVPPLLNVGFVVFQGKTSAATDGRFDFGATAGLMKRWDCYSPYDERPTGGWSRLSCPWSIDIDVDYTSSIFDSRFLGLEYESFLGQIGSVPGMASSVKATLGALAFVGEWNSAISDARFVDDAGTLVTMKPKAWQVSLAYQFGWNPWVEAIGAQGSYFAFSYSESRDLAGVMQSEERVGFVPRRRFSVNAAEWILDSLRFAIEYSRNFDYPLDQGGEGDSVSGITTMITYAW